jgi:hypothetical protein
LAYFSPYTIAREQLPGVTVFPTPVTAVTGGTGRRQFPRRPRPLVSDVDLGLLQLLSDYLEIKSKLTRM